MGHIHVYDAYAAPCDDPESQLDLSNGSKDRENFHGGAYQRRTRRRVKLLRVPNQLAGVFELQLTPTGG